MEAKDISTRCSTRWPGRLPPGLIVDEQVRLIDLMPTIVELAGLPSPPAVQGRSLGPALNGGALEPEPALCELLVNGGSYRALRTNEIKYLSPGNGTAAQTFDLVDDPREQHPIDSHKQAQGWHDVMERMVTQSETRLDEPGLNATVAAAGDALLARLQALGYLDGRDE
jgi:arylsulfatase A-like enzyme